MAKRGAEPGVSHNEPPMPRAGTKLAILVSLLEREGGATIEEMSAATGWKAHSVRGVMSAVLPKKFEMRITSQKMDGRGRVYHASQPDRPR